jgi:hypothetical protein
MGLGQARPSLHGLPLSQFLSETRHHAELTRTATIPLGVKAAGVRHVKMKIDEIS